VEHLKRKGRCKIYIVNYDGLNSVLVEGKDNKFNVAEVLKVSVLSKEIVNSEKETAKLI
jgi:hypothetical protein